MSKRFKFEYDDQDFIINVDLLEGVSPNDLKEINSRVKHLISLLVMQGNRASAVVDMTKWKPNPDADISDHNIEFAGTMSYNLMNASSVVERVAYIIKDVAHLEIINRCHMKYRTCDKILYFSKPESALEWIEIRRQHEQEWEEFLKSRK